MRQPALRALLLALLASCAAAQAVTPPAVHLGRPVGGDNTLADWNEVASYWRRLAEESPCVEVERIGETTEGRDFLMATIASEENLERLDEIKRLSARIADPRGASAAQKEEALARGVPILMISLAMHSTETAGTQFGMELGYLLATSDEEPWRSARQGLVVNVIPCTNPDGLDHVVEWYRQTVGTPHEASGLLKLYQYYAGHDNNRDWFMLTQNETRIVTEQLYRVWRPQVYWDVHQQGQSAERMFLPPFRDPLNPNLDPAILAGIGTLGSRALFDMTREGLTGLSTGVRYDMWWNGGNRNVPVRHNIIGLLTEAASVNVASPIFLPRADLRGPAGLDGYRPSNQFPAPWPGGWWRLRDIIDYELAFVRSILGSLLREPRVWLAGALEAAERAIESGASGAPSAWILPSDNADPGAVRRLVDVLLRTGVEIDVADGALEADGRSYPAGSIVIRRAQPYGAHVKDLFEVQRYPEGDPPYDVAGWTLPYLLGVHRVEVMGGPLATSTRRVTSPLEAIAAFEGAPEEGAFTESDTWPAVFDRLARGERVDHANGRFGASGAGALERLPLVGVYAPWSGSMDEGWLRWVLDTNGLEYVQVRNEMLRAGKLAQFLDCLILPSIAARSLDEGRAEGSVPDPFAGGLAPEGAVAIEEFVRSGGTLIAIERACPWAIELLGLPLVDVTQGEAARDFSCPGSVLRAIPAESSEPAGLTAALPRSLALFFSGSLAWKIEQDDAERVDVLLRYAPTRTLLSGWLRRGEVIADQAAWVRAKHGAGRVHLFGFSPHYRGWSQATFPLLFRAVLFDS
jgi:hypothetical protein